jgi:dTDP-6-deoxy-L-talose 4-dehydrogenase (NAD+)
MKVHVTGSRGFIGRHVMRELVRRGIETLDHPDQCTPDDAVIHLGWRGLPNFESTAHYENLHLQSDLFGRLRRRGVRNLTIPGTCLETVPNPPHYAKAKLALYDDVREHFDLKWIRLWYVWGQGQRPTGLVPSLFRAIANGKETFSVVDGERDFVHVRQAAFELVDATLESDSIIKDCSSGSALAVDRFCREISGEYGIEIVRDYPAPAYEPFSFHGTRF